MILVLEGPDGSGKSALAEQLSEHYHLPIHHFDDLHEHTSTAKIYLDAIRHYAPLGGVIFDRFTPSEYVYADIRQRGPRGPRITELEHRIIQRLLLSYSPMAVFLTTSPATLERRWKTRGETPMKSKVRLGLELLDPIIDGYRKFQWDVPTLYQSEENSFESLTQAIDAQVPSMSDIGWGSPHRDAVRFVVDFVPLIVDPGSPSMLITQLLHEVGWRERDSYFVHRDGHYQGEPCYTTISLCGDDPCRRWRLVDFVSLTSNDWSGLKLALEEIRLELEHPAKTQSVVSKSFNTKAHFLMRGRAADETLDLSKYAFQRGDED